MKNLRNFPNSLSRLGGLVLALCLFACESKTTGIFQPGVTTIAAESLAFTTAEDTAYSRLLSGSSTRAGSVLAFTKTSGPQHGTVSLDEAVGTFTYTPSSDYHGADSFTFVVSDGVVASQTATVLITVSPVNDPPISDPSTLLADEDVVASGTLVATDVDGDALYFAEDESPDHGTLALNPDGTFTYTPDPDFSGADSFTYVVTDGTATISPVTVTINVDATPNSAPIAADSTPSTPEDTPLAGNATATDPDFDPVTYTKLTDPGHGTLSFGSDGSYTYTPDSDYFGSDSFTFKASDGSLDSNTGTVTITVTAVNDLPSATGASFSTNESAAYSGTLAGSDLETTSGSLVYAKATDPSNGTVTVASGGGFTYTPNAGFHGSDSFTFTVSDGTATSAAATMTATVTPILTISSSQPGISATSRFSYAISGTCLRNGVNVALSLSRGGTTVTGTAACNGATYSGTITTGYELTDGAVTIGAEFASAPLAARTASVTKNSGCTGNTCSAYVDNANDPFTSYTLVGSSANGRYYAFQSSWPPGSGAPLGDASGTFYLRDRDLALTYRMAVDYDSSLAPLIGSGVTNAVSTDGTKIAFMQYTSTGTQTVNCTSYTDSNGNGIRDDTTESCGLYSCDTSLEGSTWLDHDTVGDGSGRDGNYTEGVDTCFVRLNNSCYSWSDDGDGIFETGPEGCDSETQTTTYNYRYILKSHNRSNGVTKQLEHLSESEVITQDGNGLALAHSGTNIGYVNPQMKSDGTRILSPTYANAITWDNSPIGTNSTLTTTIRGHVLSFGASSTSATTSTLTSFTLNYQHDANDACPNVNSGMRNYYSGEHLQSAVVPTSYSTFTDFTYNRYVYNSYSESSSSSCDAYDTNNCTTWNDLNGNAYWDSINECTGSLGCTSFGDANNDGIWQAGVESCSQGQVTCDNNWNDTDGDLQLEGPYEACDGFACSSFSTSYACNGDNSYTVGGFTLNWP